MANALVLQTDLLGEIAICQLGGSLTQTAYALLSDLVTIRRRQRPAPHGARAWSKPVMTWPPMTVTGTVRAAERQQLVVRRVVFFDVPGCRTRALRVKETLSPGRRRVNARRNRP